ncbi:hypothetical protein [Zymobacter palmae]|nr:hypothetical protein [Zymobacter palmae]
MSLVVVLCTGGAKNSAADVSSCAVDASDLCGGLLSVGGVTGA